MIGYLNKEQSCVESCGNSFLTKNESCDDGNLDAFDGCFNCQYMCDEECEYCQSGFCFQCKSIEWQVNTINNRCEPICGDKQVVGYEQCDDGNNVRYDGCFDCYYECEQVCTSCIKGVCHECNTIGWQLENFQCIPICGDLLIVGYEQCDDGNDIPYDGCFQCEFQCQNECTNCLEGVCKECNTQGWVLQEQTCFTYCGDGIVVSPYEVCDDGNSQPFDGCFDCDYQCQEICGECYEGRCYRCNELGWVIENFTCVPYCGDGLIVGKEQCDSGLENVSYCQNCILICDKYCTNCEDGICYSCDQGRYLENNLCNSLCGDGILVDEDCDDGNLENRDGCSEDCKIEKDWVCLNNQLQTSSCLYSVSPIMMLKSLTQYPESEQAVSVTFNQAMMLKYEENYTAEHYFKGNITNLLYQQYEVVFDFKVPPKFRQAGAIEIIATVKFFENIEDPILIVTLNQSAIVTEYQIIVFDNEKEIRLNTPVVLSQSQINTSQSAKSFMSIVIYFMITLCSFCIITGSFEIFWNLMDLLQYLSYIKYINIQFPTNLNIYFEVFKLISIQPLMDVTGISSIFNIVDGDQEYFVETTDKFKEDKINGYFFTNFQSSIFCFLGLFSGYLFAKGLATLLYKLEPYKLAQFGYYPSKFVYVARNILKKSYKSFYFSSIIKMIMSNYYDISFSVFIQLMHFNKDNTVLMINSYSAFVVLVLQIIFFTYMFTKQLTFTRKSTTNNIKQYHALFEGIVDSSDIWITQYNTILLLKKQVFIFLIVYMDQNGPLQTITIGFIQTVFLAYIYINKPLENIQEYYKTLVAESLLAFNTLLFLTYSYRLQLELSIDDYIMIGWIHIASFSFILVFSLIFDFKSQAVTLYKKVLQIIQGKRPKVVAGTVVFY